jgi:hypothetical protein
MTDVRSRRILQLLADPELHGDLLLVGMAMAAWRDFGHRDGKFYLFARDLWRETPDPVQRLKTVIASDVRTYKPPAPADDCRAPMQRRAGLCGQSARPVYTWLDDGTVNDLVTNWVTGEYAPISACSRHTPWAKQTLTANHTARPQEVPLPLANIGGILAKHFPELNWYRLWAKCDPFWRQHPEVKPWPKPQLDVLLGDGDHNPEGLDIHRPELTVLRNPELGA